VRSSGCSRSGDGAGQVIPIRKLPGRQSQGGEHRGSGRGALGCGFGRPSPRNGLNGDDSGETKVTIDQKSDAPWIEEGEQVRIHKAARTGTRDASHWPLPGGRLHHFPSAVGGGNNGRRTLAGVYAVTATSPPPPRSGPCSRRSSAVSRPGFRHRIPPNRPVPLGVCLPLTGEGHSERRDPRGPLVRIHGNQRHLRDDVRRRRPDRDQPNQCPECNGRVTTNAVETVCEGEWLVVDEQRIDHGPEWRGFEEDERERTGAPLTAARYDWACRRRSAAGPTRTERTLRPEVTMTGPDAT